MEKNDIEVVGLLYEGLMMELEMWDVLNTAFSQKWSAENPKPAAAKENKALIFTGTDDRIREKIAIYLSDTISNYEVSKEELRQDIEDIMLLNFNVVMDDGSDMEVFGLESKGDRLQKVWQPCLKN